MEAAITHLLDYAATNLTVIVQYKASDTILHIDSETSNLSKPRTQIRTVGNYYLILLPSKPEKSPDN